MDENNYDTDYLGGIGLGVVLGSVIAFFAWRIITVTVSLWWV